MSPLDKIQKRLHGIVADESFYTPKPLSHNRCNFLTNLSLFPWQVLRTATFFGSTKRIFLAGARHATYTSMNHFHSLCNPVVSFVRTTSSQELLLCETDSRKYFPEHFKLKLFKNSSVNFYIF